MDGEIISVKFHPETDDIGHRDWAYVEVEKADSNSKSGTSYDVYRLIGGDGNPAPDEIYEKLIRQELFEYVVCKGPAWDNSLDGLELLGGCSEKEAIEGLKGWRQLYPLYDAVLVRWELNNYGDGDELSNPVVMRVNDE